MCTAVSGKARRISAAPDGNTGAPPVKMRSSAGRIVFLLSRKSASRSTKKGEAVIRVTPSRRICATMRSGCRRSGSLELNFARMEVQPTPRLTNSTMGSRQRSTSAGVGRILSINAANCSARNSWLRSAALGVPVLPVVKVMSAVRSASTCVVIRCSEARPRSDSLTGMRRISFENHPSSRAFRIPIKPLQSASRQQTARRSRLTHSSRKTAVAPR